MHLFTIWLHYCDLNPVLVDYIYSGRPKMFETRMFLQHLHKCTVNKFPVFFTRCIAVEVVMRLTTFHEAHETNFLLLTGCDRTLCMTEDIVEAERLLRAQRPNVQNRKDLLDLLQKTRDTRRQWVENSKPTITDFVNRYPRFLDMTEAVSYVFCQ